MITSGIVVASATVCVVGLLGIWSYVRLRHRSRLGSSSSHLVATAEGDSMQTGRSPGSASSEPMKRESVRRYTHPKIGLFDLQPEVAKALSEAGYAVDEGSFGRPYNVTVEGTGLLPVVQSSKLPGLTEKEIVVVDL